MTKQTYHILLAFMRHVNKPEKRLNDSGLCVNLNNFMAMHRIDKDIRYTIQNALKAIFVKNGWHKSFPFNADYFDYMEEADNNKTYQNPRRLAFIASFLSGEYRHLITQ